jgi:hypothetical protein
MNTAEKHMLARYFLQYSNLHAQHDVILKSLLAQLPGASAHPEGPAVDGVGSASRHTGEEAVRTGPPLPPSLDEIWDALQEVADCNYHTDGIVEGLLERFGCRHDWQDAGRSFEIRAGRPLRCVRIDEKCHCGDRRTFFGDDAHAEYLRTYP